MDPCARRAWLELDDGRTMPLDDDTAGYWCTSLDLGYPEVRDVVNPRPDQHGVDDRTQYFGGRVVSADITAGGPGVSIDEVAASFAPYMLPANRPALHYILDRPGRPERVITLRASGYAWPIVGPWRRDIHLQWLAADPVLWDPTERQAIAWAGSATFSGRTYPWTPDRQYPAGGGLPTTARIEHAGDINARPLLRIYGPITGPRARFATYHPDGFLTDSATLGFVAAFTVDAGHYVEVDTVAYTVRLDGDPGRPAEHFLVWTDLRWPVLAPLPSYTLMSLAGGSANEITQIQARWRDGFLA
jgi:hypothetical protein